MSYLHLFVSYYGYIKMAENNTSAKYNLDENSNFEGFNNEIESIVPHSDPDSSDIEGLSVGYSEVSGDHTDLGIFSDIRDQTNNYAIFKHHEICTNRNNLVLIVCGRKPQLNN